jgi:hypothetical protein
VRSPQHAGADEAKTLTAADYANHRTPIIAGVINQLLTQPTETWSS